MNEFFKKMIFAKMVIFGSESINLLGRRVALIPIEVILKMEQDLAGKLGKKEAREFIYNWGKYQTETGSKRYLSNKKALSGMFQRLPATGNPSLELGRNVIRFCGWGDIKILTAKKMGNEMVLEVKKSPFALEYLEKKGKSKGPVCNYLAGIIAGVAKATYKKECVCTEKSCAATGIADSCLFELKVTGES